MQTASRKIIIIGAGMIGLFCAAVLAEHEIEIVIVEGKKPKLKWQAGSLDARVSAINLAVYRMLINLSIWEKIRKEYCCALDKMLVWDELGGGEIEFSASEASVLELGFIVENREIVRALWQHLQNKPNVIWHCPNIPSRLTVDEEKVHLLLDNHTEICADIIIGADGAHSWVRNQIGFLVDEKSYHQQAIVAIVKSQKIHHQMAYQNFRPTGPIGLLPLTNPHHMSMIWSADDAVINDLMQMEVKRLNDEITQALAFRLGEIELLTKPIAIPLIARAAKNYVKTRVALIGDACHTIHPLAGQGANLGFMDAAVLAEMIIQGITKDRDIGALRVLRCYERARKFDNTLMLAAMRGFKELFAKSSPLIVQLRSQGLNLTNNITLIKNCFARYAMGDIGELPQLAEL